MSTDAARLADGKSGRAGELVAGYQEVRRKTEAICQPLETEDYLIQAMPDVSPPKWHLGHVSWFFETFLLRPHLSGYRSPNPNYEYLFNSYYNGVGPQFTRAHRGHLSRPTVGEIYEYRAHVDESMLALIETTGPDQLESLRPIIELGMNHEELLVTDIKYNFWANPLRPIYQDRSRPRAEATKQLRWIEFQGGLLWVGYDGSGFAFDNESPRHQAYVTPFRLASRPVTNGEYLEFMQAGGYRRNEFWLSEGWKTVQELGWTSPLYWEHAEDGWWTHALSGMQPVDEHEPVAHVSYFEADAYAR